MGRDCPLTAVSSISLAISIVFMQTRFYKFQSELTDLNTEPASQKTEWQDVRQEVNELTRYDQAITAG